MTYADMTDDEIRLEVARRLGYVKDFDDDYGTVFILRNGGGNVIDYQTFWGLPDYPRDLTAAFALLDSMRYPPDANGRRVPVAYVTIKQTCNNVCDIDPLDKPEFTVTILGRNPIHSDDYEATADTKERAACEAWLAWKDGQNDNS